MALKITHYLIILWIRNLGEVQQCPLAQDLSQGCDQGVHWGCRRLKAQLEKDPLLSTLSGPWQDSVPSKLLDSGPWFLSGFWPGAALSSLASLQGNIQHHNFSHQNTVYIFLRYQKSLKVQKSLVKYHNYKTLGYFLSLYYEDISYYQGFPCSSDGKEFTCTQETKVQFLGQEDSLEKEMATYSSSLAWRIPRTEEPGGLQEQ